MRLNTSLLEDTEYVNYIKSNLKIWKTKCSGENPKNCWEYLKFKIREYSIGYSNRKAKLFKTELKELEKEVDHCEKSFKSHSDDIDVLNNYNISKSKLEKYYDKILQGSIIRLKNQNGMKVKTIINIFLILNIIIKFAISFIFI